MTVRGPNQQVSPPSLSLTRCTAQDFQTAPYSPTRMAVYLCRGSKGHCPFPSWRRGCPRLTETRVKLARFYEEFKKINQSITEKQTEWWDLEFRSLEPVPSRFCGRGGKPAIIIKIILSTLFYKSVCFTKEVAR